MSTTATTQSTLQSAIVTLSQLDYDALVPVEGILYIIDNGDGVVKVYNGADVVVQEETPSQIKITYSDLKSLRDSGKLVPGQQYRITDYECTTTQSNTSSAGHKFDIIVTADSESRLSEIARADNNSGDTYFSNSNLNAWKLSYCLDNDTDRFQWADPSSGRGVVYRMVDEFNNDCPYDFKNIMFKPGAISNPGTVSSVFYYTFSYVSGASDSSVLDYSLSGTYCYCNSMKSCFGMYTKLSLPENVFRNTSNTHYCSDNVFENNCFNNVFGSNCYSNVFGSSCYMNYFGSDCYSNVFHVACFQNTFGNYCAFNRFEGYSYEIKAGTNFTHSTIGSDSVCITLGPSKNSVKNYYVYIKINNGVSYVNIDASATTSSSSRVKNIVVEQSCSGASDNNRTTLTVPSASISGTCETRFGKNSSGSIKTWTPADAIPLRYSSDITGNSTDSSFVITHNLGTRDLTVNIYDKATNNHVNADVEMTSVNSVTVTFAVTPATGENYRVTIVG